MLTRPTPLPTITDAAAAMRSGATSSVNLVEQSLANTMRLQAETRAFISVVHEPELRRQASAADDELRMGTDRGPLHGMPISIKDLIDVAGFGTTAASKVLFDQPPAEVDAPVVARLKRAGAIIIGKTNLHEFALGTTSEDSAFGAVHNPYDLARSAGGSSGGSAVAVAAGMGIASIGSDTGGSIRIPASACGVVGLKPAKGDVPTDGVIPLSTTFDHVGPLARSVEDAAILWAVLAGHDTRPIARDLADARAVPPATVVRLRGYFDRPIAPDVRAAFERALDALSRAGTEIVEAEIPNAAAILEAYVNVVLPEGAAWHARWLNSPSALYSPIVRARFESGRAISAVKYLEALEFCRELTRAVNALLEAADAIVLPTLPITAPLLGSDEITIDPVIADRTAVRSAMLKHTQPFNMTGHPAISLPLPVDGLPVGFQIVGRSGDTAGLLAIAASCERIMGHA